MRIGFDIDGVLASFEHGAAPLMTRIEGTNLFPKGFPGNMDPPVWEWPEYFGHSSETVKKMWEVIRTSPTFWLNLPATDNAATLRLLWKSIAPKHDIYFITARPGDTAKRQTELWLLDHIVLPCVKPATGWGDGTVLPLTKTPTVLISHHKGLCAAALDLDCYIDDHAKNALAVRECNPKTRCYLLNKDYNREVNVPSSIQRVDTLGEMFDFESLNL
jgi:hypothetical protein